MARLTKLRLANYRSIGNPIEIVFPQMQPVVLLGENNSGKSNIVKALDLALGGFYPGNHEPEDHEFFGRRREKAIEILLQFGQADPLGGRYTELTWRYDPNNDPPCCFRGNLGFGTADRYVSNEDRNSCMCVLLEADRNLRYQLSYTSKWTYLSRLMHRFHRALGDQEGVKEDLQSIFEQVKAKCGEIPEFAEFVKGLKEQLGELVGPMTHRLEVDFEAYNPVNFFHALRLQAMEGQESRTLDEMGTGEQQILAMAFAYAYAKAFHGGILLVIEEPEAHLHPLAQEWLAKRLTRMCEGGLQVVITTHSPAFVNVMNLEGIVRVEKSNGATRTIQIDRAQLVGHCKGTGAPADTITTENVLPFYAANATREIIEGFFPKVVVLVEGPTEALALPIYLEKCGLSGAKEGVAVIAVHGKGNLAKWRRLLGAYGIPTYCVFDNDAEDDKNGLRRREALRALGVHGARHEEYIKGTDWIIESDFSVFGSKFEHILRQSFAVYKDLEDEARREGIESKPFVARWVAERMKWNEQDRGWKRFSEIAVALWGKLPGGVPF